MIEIAPVYVGTEVMNVIRAKNKTVVEVAEFIGINASGLNKLLKKNDCSVERLRELSKATDFNFFTLFTDQKNLEATVAQLKQQLSDKDTIIADKDKRIADLEKENKLLREVLEVLKKR